jgi:vesicle transport through interaction with t-SNAREs protein 1
MLTATQKLENSSQNLTYAQSVLDEAQATGADILVNLDSQRQTILRSRETLQGADDNISKARKVLSSIARRAMQNKIILFGVIGFLVLAIVIIIWVKVRGSSSPSPSP